MADNIAVLDGAGAAVTVKTTDTAGVHTPHHNVDKVGGQTPAYNAGAAGAAVPRVVTASDSPEVTALGAVADAAVTNPASNGSVIALLKGLITVIGTTLVGFVDGLETLIGSTNSALGTMSAKLPAALGAQTNAASLSVAPSTDQDPIFDHAAGVKSSVTTSAILITTGAGHKYLRIVTDVDLYVNTANAAAVDNGSSILIKANLPEVIPVPPSMNIYALSSSGTATVRATPMKVR